MRNVAARWLAPAFVFPVAARRLAPAFVFFPVVARGLAHALAVSACSREPCTKLGHHPWSYPTELELMTSDAKPRCASTDPTCGPEPFDSEHACYDPSAPRTPLPEPNATPNGARSSSARCTHDGECVLVSVCHTCAHYSVAARVACDKKWRPFDEEALCGCLDGECGFFRN